MELKQNKDDRNNDGKSNYKSSYNWCMYNNHNKIKQTRTKMIEGWNRFNKLQKGLFIGFYIIAVLQAFFTLIYVLIIVYGNN